MVSASRYNGIAHRDMADSHSCAIARVSLSLARVFLQIGVISTHRSLLFLRHHGTAVRMHSLVQRTILQEYLDTIHRIECAEIVNAILHRIIV